MNDLISRLSLKYRLKYRASEYALSADEYKRFCKIIDTEPTIYSVDKVIKALEEAKIKDPKPCCCKDEIYNFAINEALKIVGRGGNNDAIEIVKQGGVSDYVCEWTKIDEEGYKNCKCNYDETIPDFFKYCPYCGRKIEAVK